MNTRVIRWLLPITLVASAACSAALDSRVSPISQLTGDTTAGKTVYDANCKSCHGTDGKGTGGSEKKNVASTAVSDKQGAINQVLVGGSGMPAYSSLTNQQIADCIAYLASLN